MITGFEDITFDLNAKELELVDPFVNGLKTKIGKKNAISNKQMIKAFKDHPDFQISIGAPRVRKIINYIRNKGLVKRLCANSKGYYVAKDQEEWDDYLKGLKERSDAIAVLYKNLKEQ